MTPFAPIPFSEMEWAVLQLCERKGWTLDYYQGLPSRERWLWLAHQLRRDQMIQRWLDMAFEKDDNKVYAETVTARALVGLLSMI